MENVSESLSSILIDDRFQLLEKIGSGSFGDVFRARDRKNQDTVAVKIETERNGHLKQLAKENEVYKNLKGVFGLPNIRWFGEVPTLGGYALVMQHLGPSLEELKKSRDQKRFSPFTTFLLAEQMLSIVEDVHALGYVHRDLKPDNFLLGPGGWAQAKLFLVDLGLAVRYRDDQRNHIPYEENNGGLTGTARYASIHSHNGTALCRRDDLESIAYMLVYFVKGCLPWQGACSDIKDKNKRYASIGRIKASTSDRELCSGLDEPLCHLVTYSRRLAFGELPDYYHLRHGFRQFTKRMSRSRPLKYDWAL